MNLNPNMQPQITIFFQTLKKLNKEQKITSAKKLTERFYRQAAEKSLIEEVDPKEETALIEEITPTQEITPKQG